MRTNIYSIYDTIAKIFNKPFTEVNDASAKRSFETAGQNQPHSADYNLYHIGYYDDNTGEIIPVDPEKIAMGIHIPAPTVASITPEMQQEDLKQQA